MKNGSVEHLIGSAMRQQQPMGVNVAQPINDVQLVALLAAHLSSESSEADVVIDRAMDLVAESVIAFGPDGGGLQRRIAHKIALRREGN